jgi:hypothetical protein
MLGSGGGGVTKSEGHEADRLPPTGVNIKNELSCISSLPYAFMACTGYFTFTI